MIINYKIIENADNDDILDDLQSIGDTIDDAKNGLGYQTSKTVNIQDA